MVGRDAVLHPGAHLAVAEAQIDRGPPDPDRVEDRLADVDAVDLDPLALERRAIGTTTRLKHSKASSNDWFHVFPNARFAELFAEVFRVLRPGGRFLAIKEHAADTPDELQAFLAVARTNSFAAAARELGGDGTAQFVLNLTALEG